MEETNKSFSSELCKVSFPIKKYSILKNLERITKKHPSLFNNLPMQKIQRIREMFHSPEVIRRPKIKPHPLNLDGIRKLLLSDHRLNSAQVEKRLSGLKKRYKKMAKNWDIEIEKLVYEKPQKVNKFLQRQLDRAKKKVPDSFVPKLEFTSAISLKKTKTISKKKKKSIQKKLILKS